MRNFTDIQQIAFNTLFKDPSLYNAERTTVRISTSASSQDQFDVEAKTEEYKEAITNAAKSGEKFKHYNKAAGRYQETSATWAIAEEIQQRSNDEEIATLIANGMSDNDLGKMVRFMYDKALLACAKSYAETDVGIESFQPISRIDAIAEGLPMIQQFLDENNTDAALNAMRRAFGAKA